MAGAAVNVTGVPEQIVPDGLELKVTDGVTLLFTVTVRALLFAESMLLHVALEVRRTVITSPFTKELSV